MFSFIIPICIRNKLHLNQLKRCVESIRNFHPINKIILINDSEPEYEIETLFSDDTNIFIEKTLQKGSADQQMFKIFLEKDTNDVAIFMQDSMLLNIPLSGIDDIKGVKFLWHCTNHIHHWDKIYEPSTPFNTYNNIVTHTDLIRYELTHKYNDYPDFLHYSLNALNNKRNWCVCIGNCSIIDRNTLIEMNTKINFADIFVSSTTNRLRRANESIFPLICHYLFPHIIFHDSYDGLYYDGINVNKYNNTETGFDNLLWCCRNKYVSKISFDR